MKLFSTLFSVCMILTAPALSDPAAKDPALAAKWWFLLTFEDKQPNLYKQEEDGAIRVESDESVSLIYQKTNVDLSEKPYLSWSWKVKSSPPPGDLSVKGEDDRPLAVYVSFPFDEENASFFEKFVRSLVVAVKGEDAPGRVISYVWGGHEAIHSTVQSPYLKDAGALIILRNEKSAKNQWYDERVNVLADYERIFGVTAVSPYQIAISADSDDTQSHSLGWIKNLGFEK